MKDTFDDIKKRLDGLFNDLIEKQYNQFEKTRQAFTEYYEIHNKHNDILKKYHWPPFARTYANDMKELIFICENSNDDNQTKQEISVFFSNRLKNNNYEYLDYLYASWETVNELKNRLKILQDIICAHKTGLYSLTIPTIIIQIEGVLAESNNHIERISYKQNKEYFKKLFSLRGKVNTDNPANDFVVTKFYEDFEWGDCKDHEISRHAIIHGENTKYATEENAVKMIHLLDFVIYTTYTLYKEN